MKPDTSVNTEDTGLRKSFWIKIATLVTMIVIVSLLVFKVFFSNQSIIIPSRNFVKMVTLPDGSKVTLNRNSLLSYPKNFGKDCRRVSLSGEAFFEISPNIEINFTVLTANAGVEVTATSFNVLSPKDSGLTQVIVSTGIAAMFNIKEEANKVILKKFNEGIVRGKNGIVERIDTADMNFLAWKTGKMVFNNDSLGYVINVLNHTYTTRVKITNMDLSKCRITVSFENQSLENVMEIIRSTLGLKIIRQKNVLLIDGQGCKLTSSVI